MIKAQIKLAGQWTPITILGYGGRGIIYAYADGNVNTIDPASIPVKIEPADLNTTNTVIEANTAAIKENTEYRKVEEVNGAIVQKALGDILVHYAGTDDGDN